VSTETILIVEDNLLVATSLRIILETSGHQVLPFARSGARALELAVAHSPDLVLMDINLEGELDGIDTASRLKEELDIHVVYISGYMDDETSQRAASTAPLGYIKKPYGPDDVQRTIKRALYKLSMEGS
jgi:CheY-like chemotaxis protein